LRLRERTGAMVIAIIRGGKIISNISPEEEIKAGDTVVFIGSKKALKRLEELEFF